LTAIIQEVLICQFAEEMDILSVHSVPMFEK
jgi:hypothetical protein